MGDDVKMSEYGDGEDAGGDEGVLEWEIGIPSGDDLVPLSKILVPSFLSVAFSIAPERIYTIQDVDRASENTFSLLRSNGSSNGASTFSFPNKAVLAEDIDRIGSYCPEESDRKKQKISDGDEEEDAFAKEEGYSTTDQDPSGKTFKRPRLVWTPQLHKRFVDVVTRLDIKNAVPKTIMQLMNVQGLTRENVASHLQKYRLYLNRVQESSPGHQSSSSSDQLFSSKPFAPPQSFHYGGGSNSSANGVTGKMGTLFPSPAIMSMPLYGRHMGMQGYHHNNNVHDQFHQYNHHGNDMTFESNPYMMQQNKYGSMANDK